MKPTTARQEISHSIRTIFGKCDVCGEPLNSRGYCLPCYVRVNQEKPLVAWREEKLRKPCAQCGHIFVPEKLHWEFCETCWPTVREYVLSRSTKKSTHEPAY